MTEPAAQPPKPLRTWRPMAAWTAVAVALALGCGKETTPAPKTSPPAPPALLASPPIPCQDAFLQLGLALDEERQKLIVTVKNVGSTDVSVTRDQLSLKIDVLAGDPLAELIGLPRVDAPAPAEAVVRGGQIHWRLDCLNGAVPVTGNGCGFRLGRGRYVIRAVLHGDKTSGDPKAWSGHLMSEGLTIDTKSGTGREVRPDAVLL